MLANRKRLLIIFGVVFTLSLVGLGFFLKYRADQARKKAPSYVEKHVDQDTEQTIYTEPNKSGEGVAQDAPAVLGGAAIVNLSTDSQYTIFKGSLQYFVRSTLQRTKKTVQIKIESRSISSQPNDKNGVVITGQIKVTEPDTIYKFRAETIRSTLINTTIYDTSGKQVYSSGFRAIDGQDPS